MEFPVLRTQRLILRQLELLDSEILFKYWSCPLVTRFMNIDVYSQTETEKMIDFLNLLFEQGKAIRWGIYSKEDSCLVGSCGFNSSLYQTHQGEIGYELGLEYWGRGLMGEALGAILDYGFETLKLNRIEAYVMPENVNSQKLLQRLGFHKEGLLRQRGYYKNRFWDEYIFSLLKAEWFS